MPIPNLQTEEQALAKRSQIHLVEDSSAVAPKTNVLYPRVIAHFIDVCVVQGFSIYNAKFFSVVMVSLFAKPISAAGKSAGSVFVDAYAYSTGQLLAASVAMFSILYFVALPLATGRTLGLGLVGLRIRGNKGEEPTMRQLALRLLGCCLTYASLGLLCVFGLRQREGRFLHDVISESKITHD